MAQRKPNGDKLTKKNYSNKLKETITGAFLLFTISAYFTSLR